MPKNVNERQLNAIAILVGILGEKLQLRRKSDATSYVVSAINSQRCNTPLCIGCYTYRLIDVDGTFISGPITDERMSDFEPIPGNEIARAYAALQDLSIKAALPEIIEFIDDRLNNNYAPEVGDVVKLYDSVNGERPARYPAFVIAVLDDAQAKVAMQTTNLWVRGDAVLLVNYEGDWKLGTHNSRQLIKIADSTDYGITVERLTDLANAYLPLDGRFGRFRPSSGRLAGLE